MQFPAYTFKTMGTTTAIAAATAPTEEKHLQIIARSTENVLVKEGEVYYLIDLNDEDMRLIHQKENGTEGEDKYGNSTYKEPKTLLSEVSEFELWSVIKKLPFELYSTDWECENLPDWTIEEMEKLSNIINQIRSQSNRLDYVGGDLFLDFRFQIVNGDCASLVITSPKSTLEVELFYEGDKLFIGIDLSDRMEVRLLSFISIYAQNYFANKNFLL